MCGRLRSLSQQQKATVPVNFKSRTFRGKAFLKGVDCQAWWSMQRRTKKEGFSFPCVAIKNLHIHFFWGGGVALPPFSTTPDLYYVFLAAYVASQQGTAGCLLLTRHRLPPHSLILCEKMPPFHWSMPNWFWITFQNVEYEYASITLKDRRGLPVKLSPAVPTFQSVDENCFLSSPTLQLTAQSRSPFCCLESS